jgi:protease I
MADLTGKSVLMVLASRDFRDEEYVQPREAFEEAGASATVASSTTREVTGMLGMKVTPDVLLDDVDPAQFDAVVFVGGLGSTEYFDSAAAHRIAQSAAGAGKPVGAICFAPVVLANAGLLDGKTATCYPTQSGNLKRKGARYTGKLVERDGNLVTGDGPLAAQQFGKALVELLASPDAEGH